MNRTLQPTRLLTAAPAVVLLAMLLAGCSSGPTDLARIGDQTITTDDFLEVARRNQGQYPGPPDSAKAALLDDLVKRQLLVMDARKRGLVSSEEQARLLRQTEEQIAFRVLIQRLAPRDVAVSDAEIEALYRKRASESHTLVVFTPDSVGIRQALAEVRRGADFGAVADRFNTTGMTPAGGDLGFVVPGTLLPPLDKALTEGPVGEVMGPIESPGDGWFLVKVLERRPREQPPLDQVRDPLRQGLQQSKYRVLLNRAQQGLLEQYHVRLEPGAAQALFARFNAPRDTMLVGGSRVPVPAAPTPEEALQVLVRYDGEDGGSATYTLGEAMLDLQTSSQTRPDFAMTPMIEQWLKSMALQRVALIEIRRRHLEEEPEVARQARERVNNVLLQAFYETLVLAPTTVTEEEVRAGFEDHSLRAGRLREARLRLASLTDSALAAGIAAAAPPAAGLQAALRAAGSDADVAETTVQFPTDDPFWSRLESRLGEMDPGEVGEPIRTGAGWLVLQLVSKEEIPEDYARLDPGLKQVLQAEALELKRARRLEALTDSLRRLVRPIIHTQRLKRVPWPVPPEPQG